MGLQCCKGVSVSENYGMSLFSPLFDSNPVKKSGSCKRSSKMQRSAWDDKHQIQVDGHLWEGRSEMNRGAYMPL